MATRSRIGIKRPDGTVKSIYCHFDGYPEGVGKVLLENYQSEEKITQLISLGDLSSLGAEIGEKTDFMNPKDGQCVAYMRDRGEEGCGAICEFTESSYTKPDKLIDYKYLWKDGSWFINRNKGEFAPLIL